MKKIYSLLFVVVPFFVLGQNLVTNPSFNNGLTGWIAGPSTSYTLPTLVAADGSDGTNSANYVATATTGFYQEFAIAPNSSTTISFWYKATGDDTDARLWSNYKDAADAIVYQDATTSNDPLRSNNGYLPTATTWTFKTLTVTSPANVTKFVLAVRAYSGGTVSFDQFSVTQVPLSVKQNNIAGLSIFPNPVTNGTLNINSDANAERNVALFDVLGKKVLNVTTSNNSVNVGNLNAGVYIVKITEEGKTATRKLVIR
jgi:hypothetical protein